MPLQIVNMDITQMRCDAIVNPTDCFYSGSGGTDRAIHSTAGEKLDAACALLEPIGFGEVAVTPGFNMPCRNIIHTVGPVWRGGKDNEKALLRSCYTNCLMKAKRLGASSVAFPLIAAGAFGFPKDKVLRIAIDAISDFLFAVDGDMEIYVCVHDRRSFVLSKQIALNEYIGQWQQFACEEHIIKACAPLEDCPSERMTIRAAADMPIDEELSDWIKRQDDSFAVTLLKLIDKKGMDDVECYKKANVTKNTFWKIKNSATYKPSKPTVLAFAIALELSMDETGQLLKSAGFSLSRNNLFDLIIEFYITNGIYDIFEINSALYQYDQLCLGC